MLEDSKRGAQTNRAVRTDECRRLQVSDQAVIGDKWVVRHRSVILRGGPILLTMLAADFGRPHPSRGDLWQPAGARRIVSAWPGIDRHGQLVAQSALVDRVRATLRRVLSR